MKSKIISSTDGRKYRVEKCYEDESGRLVVIYKEVKSGKSRKNLEVL